MTAADLVNYAELPSGKKHSAYHHQKVLREWARRSGESIGTEGYGGWALFVRPTQSLGWHQFVVEGRGPGCSGHYTIGFSSGGRCSRREAFKSAWTAFGSMKASNPAALF